MDGYKDFKDLCLLSSDVLHETMAHIVRPPNDHGCYSEFDDKSSPHESHTDDEDETKPANRDDADGGGEVDGRDVTLQPPLGDSAADSVVLHNDRDTTRGIQLSVDDIEIDGVKSLSREVGSDEPDGKTDEEKENQGGIGPKNTVRNNEVPQGAEYWELVNGGGRKGKDVTAEDYTGNNVPELVDRVESALEATSRNERGAFEVLVASMRIFLPLCLVVDDDRNMLRDNKKDLILQNRRLQKELQRAQTAGKGSQVQMVSCGTTAMIQNDETRKEGKTEAGQVDAQDLDTAAKERESADEIEMLKKRNQKSQNQIKELHHVNRTWDKHCEKQAVRHDIAMKEKEAQLAASDQRRKAAENRLEEKFKEYDQTLLHIRKTDSQHKAAAAQYKKDRDTLRQKNESMIREREEKNEEIRRLNEVVERQRTPIALDIGEEYLAPVPRQTRERGRERGGERGCEREQERKQRASAAAAVAAAAAAGTPDAYGEIYLKRGPEKIRGEQTRNRPQSVSPPLSPRGPPLNETNVSPMSLTRHELKDQVVLYREQIDVFRSDFTQERRDRETAVGQVDSLKKELEKTKAKLQELQNQRKLREHDLYVARRGYGQLNYLPEDTQEMRYREIKQQARRGQKRYTANGRQDASEKYGFLPEEHLYVDLN